MVSTIDEARTPAELAEWLRVWADGYEEGIDYLDDNDARQLAEAVERVCAPCNSAALREALERIRPLVHGARVTPYVPEHKAFLDGALGIIDAALSDPAEEGKEARRG